MTWKSLSPIQKEFSRVRDASPVPPFQLSGGEVSGLLWAPWHGFQGWSTPAAALFSVALSSAARSWHVLHATLHPLPSWNEICPSHSSLSVCFPIFSGIGREQVHGRLEAAVWTGCSHLRWLDRVVWLLMRGPWKHIPAPPPFVVFSSSQVRIPGDSPPAGWKSVFHCIFYPISACTQGHLWLTDVCLLTFSPVPRVVSGSKIQSLPVTHRNPAACWCPCPAGFLALPSATGRLCFSASLAPGPPIVTLKISWGSAGGGGGVLSQTAPPSRSLMVPQPWVSPLLFVFCCSFSSAAPVLSSGSKAVRPAAAGWPPLVRGKQTVLREKLQQARAVGVCCREPERQARPECLCTQAVGTWSWIYGEGAPRPALPWWASVCLWEGLTWVVCSTDVHRGPETWWERSS